VSAVGGDVTACLEASEVDKLTSGDVCLRANFLYEFAGADTGLRQQLRNEFTRLTKGGGFCVMWVRYHWVAVKLGSRVTFHNDTTGVTLSAQSFEVYDSARSLPVERDLRSLARILDLAAPEFHTCPQQHRGSLECGLFAAAFVWHLAAGRPIPADPSKVSLRALRAIYPDRQRMSKMAELAFRHMPLGSAKVDVGATSASQVAESAPRTYRHNPYDPSRTVTFNGVVSAQAGVRRSALDPQAKPWIPQGSAHGATTAGASPEEEVSEDDRDPVELTKEELGSALMQLQEALEAGKVGSLVPGQILDEVVGLLAEGSDWIVKSVAARTVRMKDAQKWLRPICYVRHFVLVTGVEGQVTVYDSVPDYNVRLREQQVVQLAGSTVYKVVNTGPQRLNDCAFHVILSGYRTEGRRRICVGYSCETSSREGESGYRISWNDYSVCSPEPTVWTPCLLSTRREPGNRYPGVVLQAPWRVVWRQQTWVLLRRHRRQFWRRRYSPKGQWLPKYQVSIGKAR